MPSFNTGSSINSSGRLRQRKHVETMEKYRKETTENFDTGDTVVVDRETEVVRGYDNRRNNNPTGTANQAETVVVRPCVDRRETSDCITITALNPPYRPDGVPVDTLCMSKDIKPTNYRVDDEVDCEPHAPFPQCDYRPPRRPSTRSTHFSERTLSLRSSHHSHSTSNSKRHPLAPPKEPEPESGLNLVATETLVISDPRLASHHPSRYLSCEPSHPPSRHCSPQPVRQTTSHSDLAAYTLYIDEPGYARTPERESITRSPAEFRTRSPSIRDREELLTGKPPSQTRDDVINNVDEIERKSIYSNRHLLEEELRTERRIKAPSENRYSPDVVARESRGRQRIDSSSRCSSAAHQLTEQRSARNSVWIPVTTSRPSRVAPRDIPVHVAVPRRDIVRDTPSPRSRSSVHYRRRPCEYRDVARGESSEWIRRDCGEHRRIDVPRNGRCDYVCQRCAPVTHRRHATLNCGSKKTNDNTPAPPAPAIRHETITREIFERTTTTRSLFPSTAV